MFVKTLFIVLNILILDTIAIPISPWCREIDHFITCIQNGHKIALVNIFLQNTTQFQGNFINGTKNYALKVFLNDASMEYKYMDAFVRPPNYDSLLEATKEFELFPYEWVVLSVDVVKGGSGGQPVPISFENLTSIMDGLAKKVSICLGFTDSIVPNQDPYNSHDLAQIEVFAKDPIFRKRRMIIILDAVHASWTSERTLLMYLNKFDVIVFQSRTDDKDPIGNAEVNSLREMIIKLSSKATLYLALDQKLYNALDLVDYGSKGCHLSSILRLHIIVTFIVFINY